MDETLTPGTSISHYRITKFIDEGGQGKVYLARDQRLPRLVVLKILSPDFAGNEGRLRSFEEEAKTASSLNHPNIVTIYEINKIDSINYIVEEYVEGVTIDTCVRRRRKLPAREALRIAIKIASALETAHSKGIVHRDIKPRNVMLKADGTVKVIDFGIAKLIERAPLADAFTATKTTEQLAGDGPANDGRGTLPYMSPEQISGAAVDARTDIWSFGVLLYEMLTGRLPFKGASVDELRNAIVVGPFAPLSESPCGEPEEIIRELQKIISKTLRKDKERRYQVIKDLRIDLEDLLDSLERHPPPPSGGWWRKPHAAFYAGVAVLALALLTAAYFYMPRGDEPIDSLAVLPFTYVNKSSDGPDPTLEEFSESITNRISQLQLAGFRVTPRLADDLPRKGGQVDYKEVAKSLQVRAVLMGNITQQGDDLSISVALVDVRNNGQIWGNRYNRKVSNLLDVQLEIIEETLKRLGLELTAEARERLNKRYTTNPEAYQAYLRGTYFLNKRTKEGFENGIQAFGAAVAIDKQYAQAYAGLADCHALNSFFSFVPPNEGYPKAEDAAAKALSIDGRLAEAHASLGYTKAFYRRDWEGAEVEFKRAIELNRNYATAHHWYGLFLARIGRHREANEEIVRARELDSLSLIVNRSVGLLRYYAGSYDEAIEEFKKILVLDSNFVVAHSQLGLAYAKKGRFEDAIAELQAAARLSPESTNIIAELGWVYAVSGNRKEAEKLLARLDELSKTHYVSPYSRAVVYAGLDDKDSAFEWLERAFEENSDKISLLRVEPLFESLRGDPRFAALLRRAKFPPEKAPAK